MTNPDLFDVQRLEHSRLAHLIEFFRRLAFQDELCLPKADGTRTSPGSLLGGKPRFAQFADESLAPYDVSVDDRDDADCGDGDDSTHIPVPPAHPFGPAERVPVVAVDCGLSRLGYTTDSVLGALRAAMIVVNESGPHARLYRTGPMELRTVDKPRVLHDMGTALGRDDLFVEVDYSGVIPRVVRVKAGAADHGQIYIDRLRNFLEKQVQVLAVEQCDGGILAIDGSTTLRTRDTPPEFLPQLAAEVYARGGAIVAVSKKSTLSVRDKPLQFWLDDARYVPCYRHLSPLLTQARRERNLGEMYVARFSALGPCFRVDVCSPDGVTDEAVLNQFYSSCVGGATYPSILVMAHAMSYFTSPDLMLLRAQAAAMFNLRPEETLPIGEAVFGPFAGIWK